MPPKESFLDIIHEHLNSSETLLPVFNHPDGNIQNKILQEAPDLRAIAKLITGDTAFTFHVLKAANSNFFKGLTKVSTIQNAIIRIGTGEISKIVSTLLEPNNLIIKDPFCGGMIQKLWQHSLGCAIGTRWLAKQCGFNTLADEAFIAGLLHDIGKLLLITVVENLLRSDRSDHRPSDILLNEVMENFHAEHGCLLMENWNFPETYCKVAREHHTGDADPNDTLMLMVRLVNKACNKLGIGLHEDRSIILAATPEASILGLSEIFLAKLEITLEDIFGSGR